ncbi:PREDICTED: protein FAM210A-like, partial [Ceratosolen solmsi marchali]|uniref:Protein FAM210A-like n=1 Tax=Ceratosolen solmsi marchali TaxID=326594 RepID=A0AAJ6YN08_9HYME
NTIQYSNFFKTNYSTKSELPINDSDNSNVKNVSLFQKMKQLTKNYWNVLLPVHIATSLCWVSMFYIAIKYGIDIIGILKSLHLNDKYLDALRNSNVGDWALTYALYKIFTPIRYTVTIGMTTACVRYLKNIGYLKSVKNMEHDVCTFSTKNTSISTRENRINKN